LRDQDYCESANERTERANNSSSGSGPRASFLEAKLAFTTRPAEVEHMIKSGGPIIVVDVREAEDYAKGHAPGANQSA
jgi:hypothetical protein